MQITTEVKSIFTSKLFWLGAINVAIGILTYIYGALTGGELITLNGILIIALRALTNQAVSIP